MSSFKKVGFKMILLYFYCKVQWAKIIVIMTLYKIMSYDIIIIIIIIIINTSQD